MAGCQCSAIPAGSRVNSLRGTRVTGVDALPLTAAYALVRFCGLGRHIAVDTETGGTRCAHDEWDISDSAVTPEAYYLRRREFLRVFGLGLAASALLPPGIRAEAARPSPKTRRNSRRRR